MSQTIKVTDLDRSPLITNRPSPIELEVSDLGPAYISIFDPKPTTIVSVAPVQGPAAKGLSSLGWRFFSDTTYTDDQPLTLNPFDRTLITVNGQGLKINYGTNSDGWLKSNRFYPDTIGDFFTYRLNLYLVPLVNNKRITIDFDIGSPNRVTTERYLLSEGAGVRVPLSIVVPSGGSPTMKQNGGAFYITSEAPIKLSRVSVLAVKNFSVTG